MIRILSERSAKSIAVNLAYELLGLEARDDSIRRVLETYCTDEEEYSMRWRSNCIAVEYTDAEDNYVTVSIEIDTDRENIINYVRVEVSSMCDEASYDVDDREEEEEEEE